NFGSSSSKESDQIIDEGNNIVGEGYGGKLSASVNTQKPAKSPYDGICGARPKLESCQGCCRSLNCDDPDRCSGSQSEDAINCMTNQGCGNKPRAQ
ncbi:hypothetical protein HYU21_04800, partial [Candidatus Woesearchaeota archaeon]|nr:hypothetical protein [Candidatus Woesearchaeota archaeon]